MNRRNMQRIVRAQEAFITKEYGKDRATSANYGWGQDDVSISTKVYGDPCVVVTSWVGDAGVQHEVEAY